MIFKNYSQIAKTNLRKKALDIITAGYQSFDVKKIIKEKIWIKNNSLYIQGINKKKKINLPKGRLFLIGIGKASFQICRELEKVLGNRISQGLVLDIEAGKLKYIKAELGTHPLPSQKNIKATKEIIKILKSAQKHDLILFVVCGGGSALASAPYNLSLNQLKKINQKLINSGADIYEINTIRKHLSLFKGGQAAKLAYPAQVVSLIISDVPGNNLGFVSSGPTIKDKTSLRDAEKLAKKYNLDKVKFKETPKEDKYFKRVSNIFFLSNKIPLKAMKQKAEDLGYKAEIYSFRIQGEAKQIGERLLKKIRKNLSLKLILVGGESTVKVLGKGKGGRNQELVLGALPYLKKGELIIAIASDSRDNTEAAGAIGDELTFIKAKKYNLDIDKYLADNNSFNFFKKTNDLIYTDKRINLADFVVILR